MAVNFRYTKIPVRPEIIYKHIRERVVKELEVVGKSHVVERAEIVRDFEHKPEFGYRTKITAKEIRLEVFVKNPDQKVGNDWSVGELWTALDKTGTRPHPIPRKPKPAGKWLRFQWGGPGSYKAKTTPGGRFRGPGKVVGGTTVYAKQVQHPGFKARHFTERINKELLPLFRKQAERGYRLGHQDALDKAARRG